MIIQFCKKSLDRLGDEGKAMLSSLRAVEHSIVSKDCLERCAGCDKGLVIATVDGMPVSTLTAEKFLSAVSELSADE